MVPFVRVDGPPVLDFRLRGGAVAELDRPVRARRIVLTGLQVDLQPHALPRPQVDQALARRGVGGTDPHGDAPVPKGGETAANGETVADVEAVVGGVTARCGGYGHPERTIAVEGKSVSVRVRPGGARITKTHERINIPN